MQQNKKFAKRHNSAVDYIGTFILAAVFITVLILLICSNGTWVANFSHIK